MRVTFDTNDLGRASTPELYSKDPLQRDFVKVHEAIKAGKLKGHFSETLVTLEGIKNNDRVEVLGTTRLNTRMHSYTDDQGHEFIEIPIKVEQNRRPLPPKFNARILAALELGMRALKGPARIGGIRVNDEDGTFFEPDQSEQEFLERTERTTKATVAIEARGLGFALLKSLATSFAARDQSEILERGAEESAQLNKMLGQVGIRAPRIPFEEPWFQSLLRAKDIHERGAVQRAVAEWADADSVAAHIGYGFDLFCTEDHGKDARVPSVFDANSRAWLSSAYGVKFVTISELAQSL